MTRHPAIEFKRNVERRVEPVAGLRYLRAMTFRLVLGLFCAISVQGAHRWVYTTPSSQVELIRYRLDNETGELTEKKSIPLGAKPAVMTVGPQETVLYIGFREAKSVGAYQINPRTGELRSLGKVGVGVSPSYISTDRQRKVLFLASYSGGKVLTVPLQRNGALSATPPQVIETRERAHAILIDRGNRFVYVPHTRPERIFGFRFDGARLQALEPPETATPVGYGPRHLQFHPNNKWLFVGNEQGDSLSSYRFNADHGSLKRMQTLSTLPDAGLRNSTSDVQLTTDGRFAFVANRGHNSIAMISIDQQSGRMKSLGQQAVGTVVRSLSVTPGDKFLLVAGQANGLLGVHAIQQNGQLKFLRNYEAGPKLWWVVNVRSSD